jgi:RHS repeat-associated protein
LGITYTPGGTLTYGYDNDRRIISRGGSLFQSILPPAVSSASYNHDNQLTYFSTGAASPTYDLNGNLVSDGINTYSWDARNRLTGISSGPSFSYDGVNRRQSFASSGTTTGYLYDGLNPVEEFQGASVQATLLTGLGIDERFSRTESGTTSTFLTDQLGSTVALAASNGAIATNYGYDAQGDITVTGIASDSPYEFTGRENDGDGLDYYRARYYNPAWKRFISEHPMGLDGGTNLYAYANGNPVGFRDPRGYAGEPGSPSEFGQSTNASVENIIGNDGGEFTPPPAGGPSSSGASSGSAGTRPGDLPGQGGPPNGSLSKDYGNGNGQIRDYDSNGRAQTDYDFGHDHNGAGDPHAHDWDWSKKPPRGPARCL